MTRNDHQGHVVLGAATPAQQFPAGPAGPGKGRGRGLTERPISAPFLESVQKALDAAGVPTQTRSVAHITAGESPIPIP
jgi:hypothetical protein